MLICVTSSLWHFQVEWSALESGGSQGYRCWSCLHLSCLFVVVLPSLDRMLFHHCPPPLPTISQNNSLIQLPIYTPGWRDRHCGSTPNLSCPGTQHSNAARDQTFGALQGGQECYQLGCCVSYTTSLRGCMWGKRRIIDPCDMNQHDGISLSNFPGNLRTSHHRYNC